MKNRLVTLSKREIKKSFKRFFSLCVLSFIGVSFFSGIKMAYPDMLESMDKYYDETNVYDFKLLSSLGLTDEDVIEVQKLSSDFKVYGLHFKDVIFNDGENSRIIKLNELSDKINDVHLIEGRLPESNDEIVVEQGITNKTKLKIGDTIEAQLEENDKDLTNTKFKIVGIITSPEYLINAKVTQSRGNTNIGNGQVSYYGYVIKDVFSMEYYTQICIQDEGADKYLSNSNEYLERIDKSKELINSIKDERQEARYNKIIADANKKINDEEAKIIEQFAEAKEQLDYFASELEGAKEKLDDAKEQLDENIIKINNGRKEIASAKEELENGKEQLDSNKQKIIDGIADYDITYDDMLQVVKAIDEYEIDLNLIGSSIREIEDIIEQETGKRFDLSDKVDSIAKLINGIKEIEKGYIEYERNVPIVNQKEEELNSGYDKYQEGLNKYNLGLQEYNENLENYNKNLNEFEVNKKKAEDEIQRERRKLETIEKGTWYVNTRIDNNEYLSYINSCDSMNNISNIFPLIFFMVAIMISLLSMARMAIEDRGEIGTLKALGFSNNNIRLKYFIYSFSATMIGGILGAIVGYLALPYIVFVIYKMMYVVPIFVYSSNIAQIFAGLLISIICIVGATLFTINNLLREETTSLLKPIAPPIGKKILLEKIPLLWNRFKFFNKLMFRNVFRYKRRILMTFFGIAACTMILLAGFGIKDAITAIPDKQYNDIFHYDNIVNFKKIQKNEIASILEGESIEYSVYAKIAQMDADNNRVSVIIPEDNKEFEKIVTLRDVNSKEKLDLTLDKIIINDKLAKMCGKKIGDTITLEDGNNLRYNFVISGICENYISSYVYMSKDTYEKNINNFEINSAFIKQTDINNEESVMNNIINKSDKVLNVVSINKNMNAITSMFSSLNLVVVILIVFSGALSIVVFYSLAYINMNERKREIATLKVLGYNDKEVDRYIIKEELFITIFGILIGLLIGRGYVYLLVNTIEINNMRFLNEIQTPSYFITFGIMMLFAFIVGIIIHFSLKKIKMIDSLKGFE